MNPFLKGRTLPVWGVGFLACALAVVGCSGDEPTPTFTPRAAASNVSPERAEFGELPLEPGSGDEFIAPALPQKINDFDLEAAEATARYFFAATEYGFASRDSEPMRLISHSNFKTCTGRIDVINELETQENGYTGGTIHYDRI